MEKKIFNFKKKRRQARRFSRIFIIDYEDDKSWKKSARSFHISSSWQLHAWSTPAPRLIPRTNHRPKFNATTTYSITRLRARTRVARVFVAHVSLSLSFVTLKTSRARHDFVFVRGARARRGKCRVFNGRWESSADCAHSIRFLSPIFLTESRIPGFKVV